MRTNNLNPTEEQDHIALIDWAFRVPILKEYLFHPPNGGSRNIMEAVKLKRMGTRAGVSDLNLPYPNKGYHGLWIELKRKGIKKAAPEQQIWLDKMAAVGHKTYLASGFDEAKRCLEEYLAL